MTIAPVESHEKGNSTPDFREQLRRAMQCAVAHTPEDPLRNGNAPERFRDAEDDYVLSFVYVPNENEVYTAKPAEYIELLMQAAEVLDGSPDLATEDRAYLEDAAAHELRHGEVAMQLGNSDTVSYYGVAFSRHDDGSLDFWPYQFTEGPLKKVHHAWCAAAPDDRSSTDMDIVRGLGYGEDVDELKTRAFSEPAVEEGWQRAISGQDIARVLQRLAFREDGQI